jgi:uncharacterized membrane protein
MVIILLAFTASALAYPHLPARMPIHWGAEGQVNGWASRTVGALMAPMTALVLWLVLRFLPRLDSRYDASTALASGYSTLVNAVITFLVGVHLLVLGYGLGWPLRMTALLQVLVGVLNIVIGNVLPRLPPNRFAGVRTRRTLSSPEAWARANRIGGRAFMIGGAIMVLSATLPTPFGLIVGVSALLIATLVPLVVH